MPTDLNRVCSLNGGEEVDLVGVVVKVEESRLVLADKSNCHVTISVRSSWQAEALDGVVALKSLLAFQNLFFRKNDTFSFEAQYSEVFSKVSEFSAMQKRTPLFKKFNSLGTLLKKTGSDSYVEAYEKSKGNLSPNVTNSRQILTSLPQVSKFYM